MAFVKPSIVVSFSLDGLTATFTDNSAYDGTVTLANVQSRTVTVNDGNGLFLFTVVFPAGQTVVNRSVTKDYYLSCSLSWILANSSLSTAIINYLSTQIYDVAVLAINAFTDCSCDCGCDSLNLIKAAVSRDNAVTAYTFGYAPKSQKLIDAANSLIVN